MTVSDTQRFYYAAVQSFRASDQAVRSQIESKPAGDIKLTVDPAVTACVEKRLLGWRSGRLSYDRQGWLRV
jgi:hypothetical protein